LYDFVLCLSQTALSTFTILSVIYLHKVAILRTSSLCNHGRLSLEWTGGHIPHFLKLMLCVMFHVCILILPDNGVCLMEVFTRDSIYGLFYRNCTA